MKYPFPFSCSLRTLASSLVVLFFTTLVFGESEKLTVTLLCTGSGSVKETETTYVNQRVRSGDEKSSGFGTVQSTVSKSFNGTAYVEIVEPFARIRPPNAMVPTLSSGEDGWFEIKKLEITENEITGVVRFNVLNKPKLRIDRLTGIMTLEGGLSSFEGECEPYDPETAKKRF